MSTLTGRLSRRDASALLSRISVALPLLTAFVWLCLIYGWEAWGNLTPWLFSDELEKTQLARSIAETGHAARRTVPVSAHSLVAWLTAPAWFVDDTTKAYGLLKAIQVAAMTSVIFPTYLLARQLVSQRWALFAAVAAATIPALSYSSLILEEPFAYPFAAWAAYVFVKALATRSPRWIGAAVALALVAPFVRGQLAVIPAIGVVASCVFVWTGERARRWRAGWSTWDWAGFLLIVAGVLIVVNAVIRSHSEEWEIATEFEKHRMIELGLQAAGALTIGLGILPVIAGLALLVPLARERTDATLRAFFAVSATSILAFGFYTAVKAAWNAIKFSTIVAERNLIYLSPLLLVATAVVLERRRLRPPVAAIAAAAAFALYLVLTTPYKMEFHFYFDAPGLSILQSANRVLAFTPDDAKVALVVVLVAVTTLLAVRRLTPLLPIAALFVVAWTLTGEITGARSSHQFAGDLTANLPQPLDWVDRADHGRPAIYLGQHLTDFNVVWLLEFWNRSIHHVWSNDGTAPGPGPTLTPDIVKPDGTLFPQPKENYVLTDAGLEVAGTLVTERTHLAGGLPIPLRLYRITRPLRMRQSTEGVFADGWGAPKTAYNQYSTPGNKRGFLVVYATRTGGGKRLPAVVDLRVGRLAIDEHRQPHLGRMLVTRQTRAEHDLNARFVLEAPPAPFRAEVVVTPPFRPVDVDPRNQDVRELGAQVGFTFVPRIPSPVPGRAPEVEGVFADRWMGSAASYTQWSSPGNRRGVVRVRISRVDWPRIAASGGVEIRVGGLRYAAVGSDLRLQLARLTARRSGSVPVGEARTFTLPAPRPPFRVEVRVGSTFVPAKVVGSADTRHLGARVSFSFSEAP